MKKTRFTRWAMMAASAGMMFQMGGCGEQSFLIDFAGAGAVVSGLFILFT